MTVQLQAPPTPTAVHRETATELIAQRAKSAKRRRKAVSLVLVAATFIGAAVFWLQTSGTGGGTIAPAPGSAGGQVATVTGLTSTVSRTVGAAQLQHGVALSRLMVAKDYADAIKVTVAWLNPVEAARVLNNPNAQISLGIYRPVNEGVCESTQTAPYYVGVDDNLIDGNFDGNSDFCARLDTGAASSPPTDAGRLFIANNILTGNMRPSVDGSVSLDSCVATGTTWCQPSGISTTLNSGDETNQRVLYVISSILVPGGTAQGQQTQLNTLSFNVTVKLFARAASGKV